MRMLFDQGSPRFKMFYSKVKQCFEQIDVLIQINLDVDIPK